MNQETGITTDYKTGKIIEIPTHVKNAGTLTRKLADANVKDLSPEEIHRAFIEVAGPKICRERTVLLIEAGIITMQKVNEILQADEAERQAAKERETHYNN